MVVGHHLNHISATVKPISTKFGKMTYEPCDKTAKTACCSCFQLNKILQFSYMQ